MRRSKVRRVISIFMLITMMLGVLPSIPQFNEKYLLHAAPGGPGHEGDEGEEDHKPSTGNVPFEELEGLSLRDDSGGTNLLKRGTYMGEDDEYFYIYDIAKKAVSSRRYSTLAYTLTSNKINRNTDDVHTNDHFLAAIMTPQGKNFTDNNGGISALGISGLIKERIMFEDTTGKASSFINREVTSSDGTPSVASLMKYRKADVIKIIEKEGKAGKLNWETKVVNGVSVTRANVYLQAVTAVYKSGNKPSSIPTKYSVLKSVMENLSFSGPSIVDAGTYYNLPIYVRKESNSITYLDVKNNKVLNYSDPGGINPPASRSTKIEYTKKQEPLLKFEGDEKRYKMIAGAVTAKGYFSETAKSSQYLNQVIVANKNKGKTGMATLAASADDFPALLNHLARVVKNDISISKSWKVSSGSSKSIQYLDKMDVPGGAPRTAVPIVEVDPKVNALTFTASMGSGEDSDILQSTGFVGYQLYVFCEPETVELKGDVVCYNDSTGEMLKVDKIDYISLVNKVSNERYPDSNLHDGWSDYHHGKSDFEGYLKPWAKTVYYDLYYEFPSTFRTLSNRILSYDGSDSKQDVELNEDILQTRQDVLGGGKVLANGPEQTKRRIKLKSKVRVTEYYNRYGVLDEVSAYVSHPTEGVPLYRGTYTEQAPITVLYYSENDGDLIYRDTAYPSSKYSAKSTIKLNSLKYTTKSLSYKQHKDPEVDISKTSNPVMTSRDEGVTEGSNIVIPESVVTHGDYIIRAECTLLPEKDEGVEQEGYVIPSQKLGEKFSHSRKLTAEVEPLTPIPSYTHTYTTSSGSGDDITYTTHECTVSWSDTYGTHHFDWDNRLEAILSPLNHVFTDLGGLTKINSLTASGGHEISTDLKLDFFSHRIDVDGVSPVFAAYMEKENKESKTFMKSHSMSDLISTGLVPNGGYNDKGGTVTARVAITPGTETDQGQPLLRTCSHSGCGAENTEIEIFVNTSEYTNESSVFNVNAEPSLVATKLPVATDLIKALNKPTDKTQTFINTLQSVIDFYPSYKMTIDGKDAWLLGKEKRGLKSVNVAQITSPIDQVVVDVASTWSRDKQDTGKLVMKGGYQYAVTSNKPAEFKVDTFIVVPKQDWVENSLTVRNDLLKQHETLVNSLRDVKNFKVITNLPEAFNDTYPDEFKIQNPHKRAGDNLVKSRLPQLVPNVSVSGTTQKVMKIEELDSMFADVNNKDRIDKQLESKDWYKEVFDGFEVIKQTTTIKASTPRITATNFLRNGGTGYNDLAKKVQNIPAGIYGAEFSLYQPKAKFMDTELDVLLLTKPSLFNVRGLVYDDRN